MASGVFRASIVLLIIALAGCTDRPASPLGSGPAPSVSASRDNGAIAGTVQDDMYKALAGATVTLGVVDKSVQTDASGYFAFSDLEPGTYDVSVAKLGYARLQRAVDVRPNELARLTITLSILRISATDLRTAADDGYIQCSVNVAYATNACGAPLGESRDHFPVEVDESVPLRELLLELEWVPATMATGQELEVSLCLPQADGSSPLPCASDSLNKNFYKSASGTSPVKLRLAAKDMPLEDHQAFEAWVGGGSESPYPAMQQSFTLHVTSCYVDVCPSGFTALGSAA